MRKLAILSFALFAVAGTASAQYRYAPPDPLAQSVDPNADLAAYYGSDEYFRRHGGRFDTWLSAMGAEILGRQIAPVEIRNWYNDFLKDRDLRRVAESILVSAGINAAKEQQQAYEQQFEPRYVPSYAPQYVPSYTPQYVPSYTPRPRVRINLYPPSSYRPRWSR